MPAFFMLISVSAMLALLGPAAYSLRAAGTDSERARGRDSFFTVPVESPPQNTSPPRKKNPDPFSIPKFRPTTPTDIESAQSNLSIAANNLTQYLARHGEIGDQWRQYLVLRELHEQLDRTSPDAETLIAIEARFAADHHGLERDQFIAVRRALSAYVQTLQDAKDETLAAQYADHTEALIVALDSSGLTQSERREALGDQFAWLVKHGQAASISHAVRDRYSSPNLCLSVSEALLNQALARSIEEAMPIHRSQGRTIVRGAANVRGRVEAILVDNERAAEFDLVFRGSLHANMTGSRGPVTVSARGNARIIARKSLWLTETGLSTLPAASDVYLQTHLTGACTQLRARLVDRTVSRLALRVAEREKPEANAQAASEARRTMNKQFDEEVHKLASDAQQRYFDLYRAPLLRRDAFPQQFDVSTSRGRLLLAVVQAAEHQLAAPRDPPQAAPTGDIALQLHESFVDNLAETMLGGRTLTESDLRREFDKFSGLPPGETAEPPRDADEVSITFSAHRPLTLRIADGVVALTLRGTRYISGARAYPPMNVTVRYRLSRIADGYLAEMIGDPEIAPPRFEEHEGPNRFSGREAALRRLLANRLEKQLERRIEGERLTLPQPLGDVTALAVRQLGAEDGWLTAALTLNVPSFDGRVPHLRQ